MAKKGDILKAFIEANNIETASKELHEAFNNSYPEYTVSYTYFSKLVSGPSANNGATAQSLNLVAPDAPAPTFAPTLSIVPREEIPTEFEVTQVSEINFDPSILVPIKTNTVVDQLLSYSGGIMPATVGMIPGESGSGKTTILLQLLGMVKTANPDLRILFVSSEMNQIHIYKYKQRVDFSSLDVCMLSESKYPEEELRSVLAQGWDIVMIDSLADTINKLKSQKNYSSNEAEALMLTLMDEVRRGENELTKYTTFMCTHHMTKGGSYTGSTNLKHMTDFMMNLMVVEGEENKAYIEFSKNRDGKKGMKLFYSFNENGNIDLDTERFESDMNARENVGRAEKLLEDSKKNFQDVFLKKKNEDKSEAPVDPNREAEVIPEFNVNTIMGRHPKEVTETNVVFDANISDADIVEEINIQELNEEVLTEIEEEINN